MLNLAYALVVVFGPVLAPPQWAWAKIEQGSLAVAHSYGRADRLLPFREFFGAVLWNGFELNAVKAFRKDGKPVGQEELIAVLREKADFPEFGRDVVISVGLFPSAQRLTHVGNDTLILVLPRPLTAISF